MARVLPQQSPPATSLPRRWGLLAVGGLLAVVLVAHGPALFDGFFFDDHWQSEALRTGGWGWQDLTRAATFELPGRLNHLWWQDAPLQIRYARPLAMLVMKVEYALTGADAAALHALGLAWHWLTGLTVYGLARWSLGSRRWSFAAGALFLLNPHSVAALGWIAAHNAVFSGFFLAAGMFAYVRASAPRIADHGRAVLSIPWFCSCVILWAAAVLCRESAIILPLLAIVVDAGMGGWAHLRRRAVALAVLWLLAIGYIAWRFTSFDAAQPPEPYFHAFSGPGYLAWALGKWLRLLTALIYYTPMLSDLSSGGGAMRGALTCGLMAALLLAILAWYRAVWRGVPGRWLWPAWTATAFVPVLPILMLPHFAYASAAGWSIMLAILLSRLTGRTRAVLTVLVFAATIWSLALHRVAWRGIVRCEQIIHADLLADRPAPPGTTLFFVNLPMVGVYALPATRNAWGEPDLQGCVLTFAPDVLRASSSCTLEVLGPRELLVSMPPGCFGSTSGRMLLDLTRQGRPLEPGLTIRGPAFDATVVEADAAGLKKVKFTFPRPLDSPEYRFYVSTPERPARRQRFDMPLDAGEQSRQTDQWRRANAAAIAEVDRYFRLMDILGRIVRSDVFLTRESRSR